jgi:endonuclease/exonuclease/phosphatase family metal-dependent hydrolase
LWGPPADSSTLDLLKIIQTADSDLAILLGAATMYREGSENQAHFRISGVSASTAEQVKVTGEVINQALRKGFKTYRLQLLFNNHAPATGESEAAPQKPDLLSPNRFEALDDATEDISEEPTSAHPSPSTADSAQGAQPIKAKNKAPKPSIRRRAAPGLKVATLNIRGGLAHKQEALAEFLCSAGDIRPDMIAVQEHGEHVGGAQVAAELGGTYRYVGAKQPKGSKKGGGAGWYIHKALCHTIKLVDAAKLKLTCPNCQWITIPGGSGIRDLHLASVYMPTAGTKIEEVRQAWAQLADDTLNMKAKGEVILVGDFNARVGSAKGAGGPIGQFGEPNVEGQVPNASGIIMLDFLEKMDLAALGNRTASQGGVGYTWHQPSTGLRTVIDYMLVDSKLFSASTMPKLHLTTAPYDLTDHSMMHTTIDRKALRRPATKAPVILRWKLDRLDIEETREAYQQAIAEQAASYSTLIRKARKTINDELDNNAVGDEVLDNMKQTVVTEVSEALEAILIKAAEAHIGSKRVRPGQSKSYWDSEVRIAWQKMRQMYVQYKIILKEEGPGNAAKHKFNEYVTQRNCKNALIKAKKLQRTKQLAERLNATMTDQDSHSTSAGARELWAQLKKHTKSEPEARVTAIRDISGTLQHTDVGKATALGQFYKQLADVQKFEQEPAFQEHSAFHAEVQNAVEGYPRLSQEEGNQGGAKLGESITNDEVAAVLKRLVHRKAGSPNSRLVSELLKYSGEEGCNMITELLNIFWEFECKPNAMKMGFIVSIFKKGDTEDPGNYRPLSMLHCLSKVYSKVINRRIMQDCEENNVLHEAQNGFRSDRRCEDHLLTLKEVLAGRIRAGESTYLYSTDVYKAYDCVWRAGLFHSLWQAGIKGKMWRVLKDMYRGTRSVATYAGQQSSEGGFNVDMGLAQGDPLSPTLFAIFINPLLHALQERCEGVPLGGSGNMLHSLLFADDQMGLSPSKSATDAVISTVDSHCAQWKIKLNKRKGWVMVVGPDHDIFKDCTHWDNTEIPIVNEAVYLGGTFDYKLGRDTHAEAQIKKAQAKVGMLSKFLSHKRVHAGLRQLVLDMIIKPTLESGTTVFSPTMTATAKMQSIYTNAQKKIVGAHKNTSGTIVGMEMGSRNLNSWRRQHQLNLGKRIHDMQPERLTKQAVEATWPKRTTRGPKPGMWKHIEAKLMKEVGATTEIYEEPHTNDLPCPSFKTIVQELMAKTDAHLLKVEARKSDSLAKFLKISSPHPKHISPYLNGPTGLGASLLLRCRSDSLQTNDHTKTWTRGDTDLENECPSCSMKAPETIAHLLFECPTYEVSTKGTDRSCLMQKVTSLLSVEQKALWDSMPVDERQQQLLADSWVGGQTITLHQTLKLYLQNAWHLRQSIVHATETSAEDNATTAPLLIPTASPRQPTTMTTTHPPASTTSSPTPTTTPDQVINTTPTTTISPTTITSSPPPTSSSAPTTIPDRDTASTRTSHVSATSPSAQCKRGNSPHAQSVDGVCVVMGCPHGVGPFYAADSVSITGLGDLSSVRPSGREAYGTISMA